MNVVYVCTDGQSFKVSSCDSAANGGVCDFQNYKNGQAFQRGKALRVQLAALVPAKCHVQTAAEAQADPHRGEIPAPAPAKAPAVVQRGGTAVAAPAAPGNAQTGIGGFKVGDTVKINTAFGWMEAKVLQVNGASYYVHATSGADVWKPYPSEVRRIGPLNAEDRAHGLYDLHDRVQVRFEGKWVDSEVVTTFALGDRYEVTLPVIGRDTPPLKQALFSVRRATAQYQGRSAPEARVHKLRRKVRGTLRICKWRARPPNRFPEWQSQRR